MTPLRAALKRTMQYARPCGRSVPLLLASGIETGGEGFLLGTHLLQALIRKPFAYRPPKEINRDDVELSLKLG